MFEQQKQPVQRFRHWVAVARRLKDRAGRLSVARVELLRQRPASDFAIIIGGLFFVFFVSPFTDWWLAREAGGLVPFFLWAALIGVVFLIHRLVDDDL